MQSFNFEGIKFFYEILKKPQLAIPHFSITNIREANPGRMREFGIKGVIFDKDNTLTNPYAMQIHPSIAEKFLEFKYYFPGKIVMLSNSAGTLDDFAHEKAERIEAALGIPVLRHEEKKPGGISAVTDFFKCDPSELAIFGDRYFTDVAYGNRYGMLTFRVEPFTSKGDNLVVRYAVRPLEARLISKWEAKGISAPKHKSYGPAILV